MAWIARMWLGLIVSPSRRTVQHIGVRGVGTQRPRIPETRKSKNWAEIAGGPKAHPFTQRSPGKIAVHPSSLFRPNGPTVLQR